MSGLPPARSNQASYRLSAYRRVGVGLYPPYLRAIHVVEDKVLFTFKPGICEKCGSVVTTAVSTTNAQQAITRSVKGRTAPRRSNFQARSVTLPQIRASVGTSAIRSNRSDSSFRISIVRIPRNTSARITPQIKSCPLSRKCLSTKSHATALLHSCR